MKRLLRAGVVASVCALCAGAQASFRLRTCREEMRLEAAVRPAFRSKRRRSTTCTAPFSRDARPVPRWSAPTSIARAPTTASARSWSRATAPPSPPAGRRAGGRPLSFPAATLAVADMLPEFDQYRAADRVRPDGADQVRPGRAAAVRHGRRHAERRPGQRAQHAEPSRRAIGDVQGHLRRAAVGRTAAGELSRRLRRVPRSSRTRSSARPSSTRKYGRTPDLKKLPMYCVALSFKDVYDTTDMRSTGGADVNYAMDAPPDGCDHRGRAARQGRHHLREGEPRRIQRRQRQPGRRREGRPRATSARARAARGAAPPAIPTTRRARPADRAPDRPRRSAPTWSRARSARRPAAPAASPRGATASSRWSRRRG